MKTRNEWNFIRPTTAPVISAAVMTANDSWKATNAMSCEVSRHGEARQHTCHALSDTSQRQATDNLQFSFKR
jgi:hypothetical protein